MKRVFDGLSLIAIGAVLLACTTGYLSWAVWVSIFSLWPVLLISAGIDIIGKSADREWLRALSTVVFIAALLYGAFVMPAGTWGLPWTAGGGERFSASEPARAGLASGRAAIEAGATRLSVSGGPDLAAISGEAPAGARPSLDVRADGPEAEVTVSQPHETVVWVGAGPRRSLDVTLDRSLEWSALDITAGASEAAIDLRDLRVTALDVRTGGADARVTFGDRPVRATVEAGAANIVLRVPRSARVRLRVTGGFTAVGVPRDFTRTSGIGFIGDTEWSGPGSGAAIDIAVRAGVTAVTVERY